MIWHCGAMESDAADPALLLAPITLSRPTHAKMAETILARQRTTSARLRASHRLHDTNIGMYSVPGKPAPPQSPIATGSS